MTQPRDVIDVFEPGIMINLLKAVIRHENGIQPYSDEILKKSLELADK